MKSLNEIVAELRMGDDGGKPAYRIGRADVIECVTIKELADWIEAAVARGCGSGNAAAMCEALERLDALNLDVLKFPLDGDSSEIFDADKKQIPLPAWGVATLLNGAKEAQVLARAALSAPARNCDVMSRSICTKHFSTIYEGNRDGLCDVQTEREKNIHLYYIEFNKWLFAPAAERKGECDGR